MRRPPVASTRDRWMLPRAFGRSCRSRSSAPTDSRRVVGIGPSTAISENRFAGASVRLASAHPLRSTRCFRSRPPPARRGAAVPRRGRLRCPCRCPPRDGGCSGACPSGRKPAEVCQPGLGQIQPLCNKKRGKSAVPPPSPQPHHRVRPPAPEGQAAAPRVGGRLRCPCRCFPRRGGAHG